ncbi:PspC domain-containing protein [Aciduricibacillus chroicocephali]|uniref:PspC domain-containing protein n=1 Tax=Aciduricibacillus chroicocephali TaxID=3054939 RepID=A0ABY9KT15_9BACI|nr:PspC domain-containing protein [Bacillaceae bacterium 44XB]
MKRLYRSSRNKMVAGVLGGISEYFNVDPTLVRLIFVLLALVTVVIPLVIFYLIAALIIPTEGSGY